MKLDNILRPILEASLPLWEFAYEEYENDPTPKVVVLGSYTNPNTNNELLMGVNVRLLNSTQALQLIRIINDLTSIKDSKTRVRFLRTRLKSVFDTAYRTYDLSKISNVDKSKISSKGPEKSVKSVDKPETEKVDNVRNIKRNSNKPVIKTNNDNPVHPLSTPNVHTTKTKEIDNKLEPVAKKDISKPVDRVDKPEVDNNKSIERKNVEKTGKIQEPLERSQRRLDTMSKRPEEEVRKQQNSLVPDLEDEEYRSV